MKLSDVMSSMGLASYAEIALVIFFTIFVGVVFHVYRRDMQPEFERASRMPLDDQNPQDPKNHQEKG